MNPYGVTPPVTIPGLDAWNAAQEKCRAEYAAHPFASTYRASAGEPPSATTDAVRAREYRARVKAKKAQDTPAAGIAVGREVRALMADIARAQKEAGK